MEILTVVQYISVKCDESVAMAIPELKKASAVSDEAATVREGVLQTSVQQESLNKDSLDPLRSLLGFAQIISEQIVTSLKKVVLVDCPVQRVLCSSSKDCKICGELAVSCPFDELVDTGRAVLSEARYSETL